ncbi:MAG: SRPBCC family protein [Bacteroidota bacterium]
MYIALYIIAALLGLLIILALVAPKKYRVSRSIDIQRSKADVFEYLRFIKNQDHWGPWQKRDPEMQRKFTGEDGQVGFVSWWDSDHKQVGSGEQEIKVLQPNDRIEAELRFFKPWKSQSTGFFELNDNGDQSTKVTWGFSGTNKPPMNIMMLFFNMDKAVGKDFEEGLADLKSILERAG